MGGPRARRPWAPARAPLAEVHMLVQAQLRRVTKNRVAKLRTKAQSTLRSADYQLLFLALLYSFRHKSYLL